MRVWLSGVCLAICLPRTAGAIHAPSREDWEQIQELIRQGNDYQEQLRAHRANLVAKGVLADDRKGRDIEYDRDVKYVQAIRLTSRAYGLQIRASGTSMLPGDTFGKHIPWLVTSGDRDARSKKALTGTPGEKNQFSPSDRIKNASTYEDGVTVFFPEAFKTPGRLALIIIHEQEHFVRNTTDANKLTPDENELAARRAETSQEAQEAFLKFESSEADREYLRSRERHANEKAEEVRLNSARESSLRKFRRWIGKPMDVDVLHSTMSKEELQAIKNRMAAIDQRIEAEKAERRRAEDRRLERIEEVRMLRKDGYQCPLDDDPQPCFFRLPPPEARRDQLASGMPASREDPPLIAESRRDSLAASNGAPVLAPSRPAGSGAADVTALYAKLERLAREACEAPGTVTQERLDRELTAFGDGSDFSARVPNDLLGCALEFFLELNDLNRKRMKGLNADWVNSRAGTIRHEWRVAQSRARPSPGTRETRDPTPKLPNDCIYKGRCIKW